MEDAVWMSACKGVFMTIYVLWLQEPVVPLSLKHSKALATRRTASDYLHTDDPRIMPRVKTPRYVKKPKEKIQVVSKSFRPDLKFIDQRSLLKRYKASERRLAKRREKRGLT
ncbi:uncharacterized protein EV420DRAFT_1514620, partial [Desarmillaria tabescens]